MKATGVVRKLDELGRIAIPIEIRDVFDIKIKDGLENFNDCKISEFGSYRDDVWEHKYIYHDYIPQ